mgnify:CR=1 FL=1
MYFPPGFVQTEAAICGSLVLTAYDQYDQWQKAEFPPQGSFRWTPNGLDFQYSALWVNVPVRSVEFPEPFGFVAWNGDGAAFVVFRGTMSVADGIVDLEVDQVPYPQVSNFGNVQVGWSAVYSSVSATLLAQLTQIGSISRLFFTGHSMGSALSTLALPDVATNSQVRPTSERSYVHYNFASPRVGDPGFAQGLNFTLPAPTFRIVNTEDLVPDAPPPLTGSLVYQHVGTPVDFNAEYLSTDGNHSMIDCYWYAINNPDQPQGPQSSTDARATVRRELAGRPVPRPRGR